MVLISVLIGPGVDLNQHKWLSEQVNSDACSPYSLDCHAQSWCWIVENDTVFTCAQNWVSVSHGSWTIHSSQFHSVGPETMNEVLWPYFSELLQPPPPLLILLVIFARQPTSPVEGSRPFIGNICSGYSKSRN